ncbi:MAG: hypothetical protein ACRC7O_06235 [Fimbriiglobus sp.]
MPPAPKTTPPADKKAPAPKPDKKPLYPDVSVLACKGDQALTVQIAKDLLGWEEESGDVKFGQDYLVKMDDGTKVRTTNNTKNRPVNKTWVETIAQEVLRKRWQMNGESITIGEHGQVLSGQHRLIGLIVAETERTGPDAKEYAKYWTGPCTMETVLVTGIREDDATVNTIDTGRPRTLSDVIYRSEYFAKMKPAVRKVAAKMTDHAVKMLWHRTGASADAFAPVRTHAESLDFITRHPKLLKAVKHVLEEDGEGRVGKILPPGYASAMLYLMASCGSDGAKYRAKAVRTDKALDWANWDKACEFWTIVSDPATPENKAVVQSLATLADPDSGGLSVAERTAVVVKAWNLFLAGDHVTVKGCKLKYETDENEVSRLVECPTVGGADLGDPEEAEAPEEDDKPAPKARKKAAEAIDTVPAEGEPGPTAEDDDGGDGDDDESAKDEADEYVPTPQEIEAGAKAAREARDARTRKADR